MCYQKMEYRFVVVLRQDLCSQLLFYHLSALLLPLDCRRLTHGFTFSIFSRVLTALKKLNFTNHSKITLRELCAGLVLWLIAGCVDSWRRHQWRTYPSFYSLLTPSSAIRKCKSVNLNWSWLVSYLEAYYN